MVFYGRFKVQWISKPDPPYVSYDFCKGNLRTKEVSCGGFLNLDALPVAQVHYAKKVPASSCLAFFVGDVVKYDPDLVPKDAKAEHLKKRLKRVDLQY